MNHGFSSMNFERPMRPGYFSLKEAYRWSYLVIGFGLGFEFVFGVGLGVG